MRRASWILAWGVLALAPAIATADPLLSFGPDVPLFITVTGSVRHDDNVNLTPTNKVSDTIYVIAPGTDFHYTSSYVATGLTFSEQFIRYASGANHGLNSDLANVGGNFSYKGTDVQFGTLLSYVQQDQSSLTINNINETVRQSTLNASVTVGWQIGAKTSLDGGVSYSHTDYPQTGFDNSSVWSFPVDFYYSVTPKVDVSVGYQRTRTTTVNNVGDSESNFFNVGARGNFTEKLSGQFRVGETENLPAGGAASEKDLGLGANFSYQATPKSSFSLSAQSGFTVSPLGTTEKVFTVGLNGGFNLSEAWNLSLGGSYSNTQYILVPPRTDHFSTGDVGVSYILTQTTNFQLQYVLRKDTTTLAGAGFTDNVLSFLANTRF